MGGKLNEYILKKLSDLFPILKKEIFNNYFCKTIDSSLIRCWLTLKNNKINKMKIKKYSSLLWTSNVLIIYIKYQSMFTDMIFKAAFHPGVPVPRCCLHDKSHEVYAHFRSKQIQCEWCMCRLNVYVLIWN